MVQFWLVEKLQKDLQMKTPNFLNVIFMLSLTSPNKIATGLDGLAPTDNQYLEKIGLFT